MTFTTTTWTTTSVTRVRADYLAIYTRPDGGEGEYPANMVLIQTNDDGRRRTVLGVIDPASCEVIPVTDLGGFVGLVDRYVRAAQPRYIKLDPLR